MSLSGVKGGGRGIKGKISPDIRIRQLKMVGWLEAQSERKLLFLDPVTCQLSKLDQI